MSERDRIRSFFVRGSTEQVSLSTRGLALHALTGVVLRTPVDTGRARGNWQAHVGAPVGRETGRLDKGGSAAIADGAAAIAAQRGFQQIVIENNVPYIGRLNEGYSPQAPEYYVESVLAGLGLAPGRG